MEKIKSKIRRFFELTKSLLDLTSDFDEEGALSLIVGGVEFKSGNAWSLIFAIFIASIGLNVNSTAVIIGAMLISPLMGPIVGAGFSIGTHDFDLLKKSLTNLFYAVLISILASTLFFLVSPNGGLKSELLARTQPTIFDVLIAFFGGAAGIVAITRTTRGNAVPGVAIATALMPPLCTVGYGLAHFEFRYVVGALYLFFINAVFILIATYFFTRLLGFKLKVDRVLHRDRLIHRYITLGSFLLIIPSIGMAWYLHRKSQFESDLNQFISSELNFSSTIVAKKEVQYDLNKSSLHIQLFGEDLSQTQKEDIEKKMRMYPSLRETSLKMSTLKSDHFPTNELDEKFIKKNELSQFLKIEGLNKFKINETKVSQLKDEINKKFKNLITGLEINNQNIIILWNRKPNKIKKAEVELEILNFLTEYEIKLIHGVSFIN